MQFRQYKQCEFELSFSNIFFYHGNCRQNDMCVFNLEKEGGKHSTFHVCTLKVDGWSAHAGVGGKNQCFET